MLVQSEKEADYDETFKTLKTIVIEKINDFLEELSNIAHDIAEQSLEHIHSDEVIMTLGKQGEACGLISTRGLGHCGQVYGFLPAPDHILAGRSKTIEEFLKAAAQKGRTFHVIVAEAAPVCDVRWWRTG